MYELGGMGDEKCGRIITCMNWVVWGMIIMSRVLWGRGGAGQQGTKGCCPPPLQIYWGRELAPSLYSYAH